MMPVAITLSLYIARQFMAAVMIMLAALSGLYEQARDLRPDAAVPIRRDPFSTLRSHHQWLEVAREYADYHSRETLH